MGQSTDTISDYIQTISEKNEDNNPQKTFNDWLLLFVNYSYQIHNGGHYQYTDNGYHTSHQNTFKSEINPDDDLHQKLVSLTEHIKDTFYINQLTELYSILSAYKIDIDMLRGEDVTCHTCSGTGSTTKFDDDIGEDVTDDCDECGGDGDVYEENANYLRITHDNEILFSDLDTWYYKISDEVANDIATFIDYLNLT